MGVGTVPDAADLVLEGGGVKDIALTGAIGRRVIPRLKNDEVSTAQCAHQASTAAQAAAPAAVKAKPAVLDASAAAWETKAAVTRLINTEGPHANGC
jgi:hypothetical protein